MTAERCVICHATIPTTEGGLCDDHKYDDEVFCPRCFAGTESNEHREKCSEPILRATDDYPSSDPLAELLWRHRQFDNDDDGLICGCGAEPPEGTDLWPFADQRWHDEHLAQAVRDWTVELIKAGPSCGDPSLDHRGCYVHYALAAVRREL